VFIALAGLTYMHKSLGFLDDWPWWPYGRETSRSSCLLFVCGWMRIMMLMRRNQRSWVVKWHCARGPSVTSVINHIDCGLREVGGILFTARDSPRAQTSPVRHNSALISSSYPSSTEF